MAHIYLRISAAERVDLCAQGGATDGSFRRGSEG